MNKATATNTGHKLLKVPEMVFRRGRLRQGNFGNGAECHAANRACQCGNENGSYRRAARGN
jgi:hypothetical protein